MCSYARCSFELVSQIENPEEELATDTSFFSYHIENPSILRLRFGFTREKAFSFLSFFPGGAARAVCLTLLQADSLTLGAGVKCHCAPAPYSYTYFSIHRFFWGGAAGIVPAALFSFQGETGQPGGPVFMEGFYR